MPITSMPSPVSPDATPRVALFDLDGTLTWRDTLVSFLAGYLLHHPAKCLRLWRLPLTIAHYVFVTHDRGSLKSSVIRLVMGGEPRSRVDAWAATFVARLTDRHTFRPAALAVLERHRLAGDHLVLLSASPDLYVPRIGSLLGFERTLCTEVKWRLAVPSPGAPPTEDVLDGALATPNRRGAEKSSCLAWLRIQYPGLPVVAYGNSTSDLPHLRLADDALLVNGNASARREAATMGVAVAEWS